MKSAPIPVWLVTGFLGSGKTTLLRHWLHDPLLADAALVVNEIGEVGFDDKMLATSVDGAGLLLPGQCVCCSGLPDLREALSEMWWQRLRRERPRFGSVIIETTGIADPRPVARMFDMVALLRERYALQGIVTMVSQAAGPAVLDDRPEGRAQVQAADVIVITKTDRHTVHGEALSKALQAINDRAVVLHSAQASLSWPELQQAMARAPVHELGEDKSSPSNPWSQPRRIGPPGAGMNAHAIGSRFHALHDPVTPSEWKAWLAPLMRPGLQRLKGVVRLNDETLATVQWSPGDDSPAFAPFDGPADPLGVTAIGSCGESGQALT